MAGHFDEQYAANGVFDFVGPAGGRKARAPGTDPQFFLSQ